MVVRNSILAMFIGFSTSVLSPDQPFDRCWNLYMSAQEQERESLRGLFPALKDKSVEVKNQTLIG